MTRTATSWLETLPGVRRNEPLAPHTTYRIGGPAEHYREVADMAEVAESVAGCRARGIPLLALGNGSNIVVADAGVEGLVIRLTDSTITVNEDAVQAAAGARMVKVAQAAERAGLTGMEWALGIPGTAGGSAHNNAGCFGSDMAAVVESVEGVNAAGEGDGWPARACDFQYRSSAFRDGPLAGSVVGSVIFRLRRGEPRAIRTEMERVMRGRKETQPVNGRSTGSVFKNPPGDYAGRLVEAAGMKGRRRGGAMVSRDHANFIVNAGGATASDVAALVSEVQDAVQAFAGVRLETEIEWVGRWDGGAPR